MYEKMLGYPFTLTPPSSSEDSPQSFTMHSPSYIQFPSNVSVPYTHISPHQQFEIQMPTYGTEMKLPYLSIIEQPIDKFRFRYKSEMAGTHGSLTGLNSDKTRKQTYPTVKLNNFHERDAVIRCSLYQHGSSDDRQPHAHRLIMKHGQEERDDPHDILVTKDNNFEASFHSMGIIHTAKKHIVAELKRKKSQLKMEEVARVEKCARKLTTKEEVEIQGNADEESKSINLNIVCLRFDAFRKKGDVLEPICRPLYSHAINNLKSALTGELKIVRMDHSSSPAKGNREIFMLVEKVTKKNIKIRFFETDEEDNEIWSDYGKFNDLDVHHQYAIVFRTPPYKDLDIGEQKKVFIELERPSDGSKSEPREFTYIPSQSYRAGSKRPRTSMYSSSEYSSGSLNSLDLPTTLEALQNATEVTSAELQKALTNIDSDEFNKLFTNHWPDFINPESDILMLRNDSERRSPKKLEANSEEKDKLILNRVYEEFRDFLKSKPAATQINSMLSNLFTNPRYLNSLKENALHIATVQSNLQMLRYWLNLINKYNQFALLNIKNIQGETPLHLALQQNSVDVITSLLRYPCDLSIKDNGGNTPLHVALIKNQSNVVVDTLLRSPYGTELFINAENNDNLTALHMAIKMNKPKYVNLLYKHRADVNLIDKKTGRNSLHIAITEQATEIVKLLLEKTNIDILKEDFGGFSPLKMASHLMQDKEKERVEIFKMIEKELISKGLHTECIIKEELESEEEMEIELDMVECKIEKLSLDELESMYKNVTNFTPVCLEQVSKLLDKSESWMPLANLLNLDHLIHTDMIRNAKSKSKELLQIAVRLSGVLSIRTFLDNLGEHEAVSIMDNMVRSTKMET